MFCDRKTRIFTIAAAALGTISMLAGCASPEEIAAKDRQTCSGYGFAVGTDAFANCMMHADLRRQQAAAEWQREQNMKFQAQSAQPVAEPVKQNCKTVESTVSTGNAAAPGGATTQTRSSTVCSSF